MASADLANLALDAQNVSGPPAEVLVALLAILALQTPHPVLCGLVSLNSDRGS